MTYVVFCLGALYGALTLALILGVFVTRVRPASPPPSGCPDVRVHPELSDAEVRRVVAREAVLERLAEAHEALGVPFVGGKQ